MHVDVHIFMYMCTLNANIPLLEAIIIIILEASYIATVCNITSYHLIFQCIAIAS